MENETDKIVNELCEWMRYNSFDIKSNQNVELVNSANKSEGRCVLARKEIGLDEPLVQIPLKFLVNYRAALNEPDLINFFEWYHSSNLVIENMENTLTRLDALYFILILSKHQQGAYLAKFVHSMPFTYDTPEYFDRELIDKLPIYLKDDIVKRLDKFKSKFESTRKLLTEYLRVLDSTTVRILYENFTYEEFKWAFCSVNSRCFHMHETEICKEIEIGLAKKYFGQLASNYEEDTYFDNCDSLEDYNSRVNLKTLTLNSLCCIVPYLDFLNHSFESNAYAYLDRDNKVYVLKTKSADDWLSSDELVLKPRDQVYITYGYHDNKTLLIDYGFILENSVYDRVIFKFEDFERFASAEKSEILWRKAIGDKLYYDLSCNTVDGPSWNLLRLLDLIVYGNTNDVTSDTDLDSYDSYEVKNTEEVRELLLKLLESFEDDFSQAVARLTKLKSKHDHSYHICMCLTQVKLDLAIVKFSIDLCGDEERWNSLF